MRKIFIFLFVVNGLMACQCTDSIIMGFTNASNSITQVIDAANNEITSNLTPEIEQNIKDIKKQSEVLKKIVNALREEVLQKKEIIFLLEQEKELIE